MVPDDPRGAGKRTRTQAMAIARAEAYVRKQALWPADLQGDQKGKVFKTNLTLKHGSQTYRVEIRSRKGRPFHAAAGNTTAKGTSRQEALARLILALDPEVEEVRTSGKLRVNRD